jgi:hypothetical protein
MSAKPVDQDHAGVEPIDASPPAAIGDDRPTTVGETPEGLGGERMAAPYTSEIDRPVHGVPEILATFGREESDPATPN